MYWSTYSARCGNLISWLTLFTTATNTLILKVLTIASCLNGLDLLLPQNIRVIAGTYQRDSSCSTSAVSKITRHASYSATTGANNIATLQVQDFFTGVYIATIPLASAAAPATASVNVYGWGNVDVGSYSLQSKKTSITYLFFLE